MFQALKETLLPMKSGSALVSSALGGFTKAREDLKIAVNTLMNEINQAEAERLDAEQAFRDLEKRVAEENAARRDEVSRAHHAITKITEIVG